MLGSKTLKIWLNINPVTETIDSIEAIASRYDAIVFDQWGVLHNGSSPYAGAIDALAKLSKASCKLGVLSNSGKRSKPNAARIASMGFDVSAFDYVMTSGEALWRDMDGAGTRERSFYPVERAKGDAVAWADGLSISLVNDVRKAQGILLMGLPDDANLDVWAPRLKGWLSRELPVYCSNPDRSSPREGGLVVSPGALAHSYQLMGGAVTFYGKPHRPVFRALEEVFGAGRYLMVGDSMEHDIAGAHGAGWDSLFIEGGLYSDLFAQGDGDTVLAQIAAEKNCALPTYRIKGVC